MTATPQRLWWQTGVVYQVYPRSFKDTNADGVGDLVGIIEKLDYLSQTLGVDALWLSPFYPSPMADFGYDVANYTDVDPLFGNLAAFDELVAQAHRRGLKIIIDWVPNHTSDQHPWFIESRSSRTNPKRDWYVWRDPLPDGSPPNNWLSVFAGPAWEWDEATGQYYLHSFLKEQPDLNWRNPAVKAAMFDGLRFWLERGVDGFRIDVAHYIMKDPDLRDNPPNPKPVGFLQYRVREFDTQLHLYDSGHPDAHAVFREFRQLLDTFSTQSPRMSVGEIHIFDWKEWASYYGQNLDELHMPFNFALLNVPWQAKAVRQVVDGLEAAILPGACPNYVLGNHDHPRIAGRYGPAQARVAAMLLLTLRGTPTLYYGDEIGMTDVPIPVEEQQDPFGLREPGFGRDPCRTPMQWTPGLNAGFSAPDTPKLWLPLASDYQIVNVECQLADPASILSLYRRLLAYRKATPALQWGNYQAVDGMPDDCYVYLRQAGDQRILAALNFSDRDQRIVVAGHGKGKVVISTLMDRTGTIHLTDFILRGDEGIVVVLP
jgi:alpha-glucosidase